MGHAASQDRMNQGEIIKSGSSVTWLTINETYLTIQVSAV